MTFLLLPVIFCFSALRYICRTGSTQTKQYILPIRFLATYRLFLIAKYRRRKAVSVLLAGVAPGKWLFSISLVDIVTNSWKSWASSAWTSISVTCCHLYTQLFTVTVTYYWCEKMFNVKVTIKIKGGWWKGVITIHSLCFSNFF